MTHDAVIKNNSWRVVAMREGTPLELQHDGSFDELVVGEWLHVENMDDGSWWMRVGDARLMIAVVNGEVTVDVERGAYGEVRGTTLTSTEPESAK